MLLRQTWILAVEELLELFVRKRSLFALVGYVGFIALVFSGIAKALQRARDVVGNNSIFEQPRALIEPLGKNLSPELFSVLQQLAEVSPPLVIFQCLSLVILPSLAALVSCDMITVDVYRGTLRFVLLRATRSAYYLSKVLAHFVLYLAIQIITMTGLVLIVVQYQAHSDSATLVHDAVRYVLISIPALFVIVTSTAWISSWCRRPMGALIGVNLFWILVLAIMAFKPAFTPLHRPNIIGLVAPFPGFIFDSVIALLIWSLGFLGIGMLGFLRRDI